jgi:hypothetical protein
MLSINEIFILAAEKNMKPRQWKWRALKEYNGFGHDIRVKKWQASQLAQQMGIIKSATECSCSICGCDKSHSKINYHSEDYTTMEHYPLCSSCHFVIHNRSNLHHKWDFLVRRFGDGTKWFEALDSAPPHI